LGAIEIKIMKVLIYVSFLMLSTTVCYSQSVLEITFNNLKSGKAILYNTRTLKGDTLAFENGLLVYKNKINTPTLYTLIIDEYNNSRPVNLILSNEKTTLEFENFKKPRETQNIDEVYPNTPYFLKDPNGNQTFYDFIFSYKIFYSTI
jgi:hypothetical protein